MIDISIEEKINQVSEALVLLDITDLQGLAELHTSFEDIGKWAEDKGDASIIKAAQDAKKTIGDIMLEEVSDPIAALGTVEKIATVLQKIVSGEPIETLSFSADCSAITPEKNDDSNAEDQPLPVKVSDEQVSLNKQELVDPELLAGFIAESNEHLDSVDENLLALEKDPNDSELLNAVFRSFHTIKGVAGFLALESIRSLSHEAESLLEKARKGEVPLVKGNMDVVFEVKDILKRMIANLQFADEPPVDEQDIAKMKERIRLAMSAELPIEKEKTPSELAIVPVNGQKQSVNVKEAIKVDADRLDRLIDMIGEMVIAETMVSQSPELKDIHSARFLRHLRQLDKMTKELHEIGMSLRMVNLRATFQKMARIIRDLAKKTNKNVDFFMSGEDTEIDKTVVDKIGDPLLHMVRNAVDHGIESSIEERTQKGKPEKGRIELNAYHKGGSIYIEIIDDGKGLDKDAILAKAQEKGLIREEDTLSDKEIYNLIFEPGFSTAKQVTDVSGRGVGMDVVRRNIEALNGQVEITSEVGMGSVFTIRLPLTLAIIDGMVIRVGLHRYIIPTLSIIGSFRPESKDIRTVLHAGEMVEYQRHLIALCRLGNLFNLKDVQQDITNTTLIIIEDGACRVALMVDEIIGQQQIVIKSLGVGMDAIPGLSGCAILPDGQVGLILDVVELVKLAGLNKNENKLTG